MNFNEIVKKIKEVKIQGATNIALAGIKSISLKGFSEKKLLNARPTEPMLRNAIRFAKKYGQEKAIEHIFNSEKKIINFGYKKVKSVVFTHCHSSTVINILRYAKEKGKNFKVYNTETRPLYQGRKTSKELAKNGIIVKHFVDSGIARALRNTDVVLLGCDAITPRKVYNKIGSEIVAIIAQRYKIPLYICTDSWKFDPKRSSEQLEERDPDEIWKSPPAKITIKNISYDEIDPCLITAVISELGIYKFKGFIRKVKIID